MASLAKVKPAATPFWRRRSFDSTLSFWILVAPMVVGLTVFVAVPIVWGLALSFFEARNTISLTRFVGFANYTQMLSDPAFIDSLKTIVIFAAFIVPSTYVAALGLAMLVHGTMWGKGAFRTIFFLPTACSYVIASLTWKMSLFSSLPYGLVNMVLGVFGIDSIVWIGTPDPPWHWLVLVTVRLWLQVGFYMIIFIAGIQQIDHAIYDAARVDGTNGGWSMFRYITMPLLRNTTIFVLLINIIHAFQAFDEFYNIVGTSGGFASSGNSVLARPPLMYLYQIAFNNQNFGYGTAGAFILTALVVLATLIQSRVIGLGRSEE